MCCWPFSLGSKLSQWHFVLLCRFWKFCGLTTFSRIGFDFKILCEALNDCLNLDIFVLGVSSDLFSILGLLIVCLLFLASSFGINFSMAQFVLVSQVWVCAMYGDK